MFLSADKFLTVRTGLSASLCTFKGVHLALLFDSQAQTSPGCMFYLQLL